MGKSDYKFYEDGEKGKGGATVGRGKREKNKKNKNQKNKKEYTVVRRIIPNQQEDAQTSAAKEKSE